MFHILFNQVVWQMDSLTDDVRLAPLVRTADHCHSFERTALLTHVYIYISLHIFICDNEHSVCINICDFCLHPMANTTKHIHIHIYIYVYTHIHTYTYIYVYTYT